MVVFTCNNCGDSLHKPKVEKHYQMACRSMKSLTCVDCFKDFRGEEYVSHTKCVTEDERYAAKGTYHATAPKGERKQDDWLSMVKSITDKEKNLSPDLRNLLNTISGYANVPRKKVKFLNFIGNSLGRGFSPKLIEDAWNLIEKYKNEQQKNSANNNNNKGVNGSTKSDENGTNHTNGSTQNKEIAQKRKNGCEEDKFFKKPKVEEPIESSQNRNVEFSFEDKILNILNKKKQIPLEKLKKKVLNAYIKHKEYPEFTEKHVKKFNKRLKHMDQVQINEDTVVLST